MTRKRPPTLPATRPEGISERDWRIAVLFWRNNVRGVEIARVVGVSRDTVYVILKAVRAYLEEEGNGTDLSLDGWGTEESLDSRG